MKHWAGIIAIAACMVAVCAAFLIFGNRHRTSGSQATTAQPVIPAHDARRQTDTMRSAHYVVISSATQAQTTAVVEAVEALYRGYTEFFGIDPAASLTLQLHLYRNREEFKAHNRSKPWAEAYYLAPACHAYYAVNEANPYHWMLHEATHQLNREVSGLPRARWIDEGLATYFGASRIERGRLRPGQIDADAYPIWWIAKLGLSGDLEKDIASHRIIPLAALISGKSAIGIDQAVNQYYVAYWSLTHFLLHGQQAKYAEPYRRVITKGATLEAFEESIGPVGRIQQEWYDYLLAQARMLGDGDPTTTVVPIQ